MFICATKIIAGGINTLALAKDGKVYGAGSSAKGQLGLRNKRTQNTFVEITSLKNIRELIAGFYHTLALTNDGKVYGAGSSAKGQLGLGNKRTQNTFVKIPSLEDIKIRKIIAGWYHTFALANDRKVYGAGDNLFGQLGLGDTIYQNTFVKIPSLEDIKIRKIIAGEHHTLALANDGRVYGAGFNEDGQLGLGDKRTQKTFIKIPSLGNINIREIIAGMRFTLALANDGKVYGAGTNEYGQLGLGHTTNQKTFVEITSLRNINIRELIAGFYHTLALANDGRVYGAGTNRSGQLGLGDDCKKVLKFTLIPNIRVIYPLSSLQKKLWKQETDRERIDTIIITKW